MADKDHVVPDAEPIGESVSDEMLDQVRGGTTIRPAGSDEVLVAFEHGDVKAPVIIGGLWNGKDKP